MKHITLKETATMKKMGWNIKACYSRRNGVTFVKYFSGIKEMEEFNTKLDGVKFEGYAEL